MQNESQIIGEIIEELISIKYRLSANLRDAELAAINNACNILSNRFNRFNVTDILINEYITSIHWQYDDIKLALEEKGFESSEENVAIIVNHLGLEKYIQEKGIEAGWEVIYGVISENKHKLSLLQLNPKEE